MAIREIVQKETLRGACGWGDRQSEQKPLSSTGKAKREVGARLLPVVGLTQTWKRKDTPRPHFGGAGRPAAGELPCVSLPLLVLHARSSGRERLAGRSISPALP